MKQITFSDMEYGNRKRTTKREEFLDIMEEIIPWEEWVEYVSPYYPDGKRGRPTKGIETMLRMYLLQVWFNLSDEGVEDAIYDSYASLVRLIRVFFSSSIPHFLWVLLPFARFGIQPCKKLSIHTKWAHITVRSSLFSAN